MDKGDLLFSDLSYKIIGISIAVHKELGCFAREKQYGDLFQQGLKNNNINYKRELRLAGSGNILDFAIDDKIAIEFKAVPYLIDEHYAQVKRYLHQTGFKLGIIINFREKRIKPKRVLNINNLRDPAELL